jgi:FKBP-type peptidyl-prolyl cis-trans isomerase FkpA
MSIQRGMGIIAAGLIVSLFLSASCAKKGASKINFKTENEKISYIFGNRIGENFTELRSLGYELDLAMFTRGIQDVLDSMSLALSDSQVAQAMDTYQKAIAAKQQEKTDKDMKDNMTKASSFLATNAAKKGIVTLPPDSLQYEIIKDGTGVQPKPTDTVRVNYVGTFIDGKKFDSSRDPGREPLQFTINEPGMIPGFTEIIPMMKVGSTWRVYIPPKLGYGDRGNQSIPPNSLLIFEIELLDIVKPAAKK